MSKHYVPRHHHTHHYAAQAGHGHRQQQQQQPYYPHPAAYNYPGSYRYPIPGIDTWQQPTALLRNDVGNTAAGPPPNVNRRGPFFQNTPPTISWLCSCPQCIESVQQFMAALRLTGSTYSSYFATCGPAYNNLLPSIMSEAGGSVVSPSRSDANQMADVNGTGPTGAPTTTIGIIYHDGSADSTAPPGSPVANGNVVSFPPNPPTAAVAIGNGQFAVPVAGNNTGGVGVSVGGMIHNGPPPIQIMQGYPESPISPAFSLSYFYFAPHMGPSPLMQRMGSVQIPYNGGGNYQTNSSWIHYGNQNYAGASPLVTNYQYPTPVMQQLQPPIIIEEVNNNDTAEPDTGGEVESVPTGTEDDLQNQADETQNNVAEDYEATATGIPYPTGEIQDEPEPAEVSAASPMPPENETLELPYYENGIEDETDEQEIDDNEEDEKKDEEEKVVEQEKEEEPDTTKL